ncbi:non-photochemical quenching [Trifolium repens]|nr:non-photochemical quenching [Trifolium repens]
MLLQLHLLPTPNPMKMIHTNNRFYVFSQHYYHLSSSSNLSSTSTSSISFTSPFCLPSSSSSTTVDSPVTADDPPVKLVAIVGHGAISPLNSASWEQVMLHTAKRLKWVDEGYELLVFTDECIQSNEQMAIRLERELLKADILVIVAVTNKESVNWIKISSKTIENVICFDSSPDLKNRLGGYDIHNEVRGSIFGKLLGSSELDKTKDSNEVVQTVSEAWDRRSSDDIRFCLLLLINAYIRPVPILKNLRAKGFSTLNCMLKNCGRQVLNCLLDPNCRKALQCLNKCSPVDQVCNYRCIASYESENLEAFSLCVLQKNNCLELEAEVPTKPYVPPMVAFRGQNLSHEIAEDLFVGWLGSLQWSWRVVAGQNPAYDQFPCQYQLFYRGKAKGSFWYEPVFQVKTFEGQMVWRRRKYRVKRAEDLSWGLFHYHGAARAAGQSYTGAVLVSPDGAFPNEKEKTKIVAALDKCEIKEWELYFVDNCSCIDAPLGTPEGSRLHAVVKIDDPNWIHV